MDLPRPESIDLVPLRTRAAIRMGAMAGQASRVLGLGAGAQIPGRVALALAPSTLAHLTAGRTICLVSGTNGKTTTARLITSALRGGGTETANNATGANMASGLVAPLAAAHGSTAVLEVDEGELIRLIGDLNPDLLVLTNLSRDQLDRHPETRSLAAGIRRAIGGFQELHVIANASDPLVVWAVGENPVTWVDVGLSWTTDASTCPVCGSLLAWRDDRFDCDCGFRQPCAAARLEGEHLVLGTGKRLHLRLSLPGRWNLRNAALAACAVEHLGGDSAAAAEGFARVRSVGARYATRRLPDGRTARIMLGKNPAGWAEILAYLTTRPRAGVVVAVNANSADGRDTSWLWDVPFEMLKRDGSRHVAASGERYLDIAARLHHASIDCVVQPDPMRAAMLVEGDEVNILPTYSAFQQLSRR